MNNEFYRSRIRGVFESRLWLRLNLICALALAMGPEGAFAQVQRERQFVEGIKQLENVIYGSGLFVFLTHALSAFKERKDIVIYVIGAAVTIAGALLTGKAVGTPGTLQVERTKLLVKGAPGFMVCAAGILIILFGFFTHNN
jgi:hypothetical protein